LCSYAIGDKTDDLYVAYKTSPGELKGLIIKDLKLTIPASKPNAIAIYRQAWQADEYTQVPSCCSGRASGFGVRTILQESQMRIYFLR
jgi:hypothetical protein